MGRWEMVNGFGSRMPRVISNSNWYDFETEFEIDSQLRQLESIGVVHCVLFIFVCIERTWSRTRVKSIADLWSRKILNWSQNRILLELYID